MVNLIKAGGRRCSSREQVPLTVESGSTIGLALPLSDIVLPVLCSTPEPLVIFTTDSLHFSCHICRCLLIGCRNGGPPPWTPPQSVFPATWFSLTFTTLISLLPPPVHCVPASYAFSTTPSIVPTCLDQSSQTGSSSGENTLILLIISARGVLTWNFINVINMNFNCINIFTDCGPFPIIFTSLVAKQHIRNPAPKLWTRPSGHVDQTVLGK